MTIFRQLFRFYINSSIHVALSCVALFFITQKQLLFSLSCFLPLFIFSGTVFAYNFVKYESIIRSKKNKIKKKLKAIVLFSGLMFFVALGCFFQLQPKTQLGSFFLVLLTLLYALPFFPNYKNARNWKGIKIYIVALCWTLTTVLLPVLEENYLIDLAILLYSLQRFILVFVLVLIFEIVDLNKDDPHLQTVPQQIGVKQTKLLGYILLIIFCALELFNGNNNINFPIFSLIFDIDIVIVIAVFLAFANENRSKYYTSFWVESVTVFWWIAVLCQNL